jgi:hypothetical protein
MRLARKLTPLAALVAFLLVAAGCGGSEGTDGFTRHEIEDANATVLLPDDWRSDDPEIARVGSIDPAFLALAPEGDTLRANLNVIVQDLAEGQSVRAWLLGSDPSKLEQIGTVEEVKIGGEPALRFTTSKLTKAAGKDVYNDEYAFDRGGRVVLFTYTALASEKGRFEDAFATSAQSIAFAD